MVLSLLLGKKYAQSRVGTIFLDATISEDHQYNSRVTNYPVENNLIISDHIINDPDTLQITGIVSDTPLNILSPINRSVDAFNRLVRIHVNKERISVVTGIKVYVDMVITSLQVPRNMNTGQSLTFVIDLQKVVLSNSVRLNLDLNNPFTKVPDKIPREIVADANKYPFLGGDPNTSLKDQSSSAFDVGIQDLQDIPPNILPNILSGLNSLQDFV